MAYKNCIAVDLGASSGRVINARFDAKKVTLEEAHRFPNGPVLMNSYSTWDFPMLFNQVIRGISKCPANAATVGIDTWGTDFGMLDRLGNLVCIFYNPVDSDAAPEAVKLANDAGVPVITVDRSSNGGEIACHVASDNVYGGEIAAQYLVDALGEGNFEVVEIQGQPGASAATDRSTGFHNVVDKLDNITVVVSQPGNWQTADAMTIMENALTSNPDVKGVFSANDQMAMGVIQACQNAGRDDIIIVGFDAESVAIDAIKGGTMKATIQQLPEQMGADAANAFLKLAAGETIEPVLGVQVQVVDTTNAG